MRTFQLPCHIVYNEHIHLILLGGNNKSNKDWIINVEKALKEYFDSSHIHEYKHWQTDQEMIEIEHEIQELISHIKDKDEKDYVIFAKSAGAVLTMKAVAEGHLNPYRCIFAGVAIKWAKVNEMPVDEWIQKYKVPTLFFQKSEDPAYSYRELQSWLILNGVETYKTVEFPGKDHHYEDVDSIKKEVGEFLFS